ncbi:MAG: hypothetical protein JSW70_02085 [Syntrophobacterales bacterium]|nr:MAG: hypothetical protein JSW70_02085 [Syntrophobacterales bacterium]
MAKYLVKGGELDGLTGEIPKRIKGGTLWEILPVKVNCKKQNHWKNMVIWRMTGPEKEYLS